jgi:hypothetical protein
VSTLINVADVYTNACDEAVELHLSIHSDVHPDKLNYNKPSFHGALNGLILASKAPNQSVLCHSCAYKQGTLANSSLSTQSDVAYALSECALSIVTKILKTLIAQVLKTLNVCVHVKDGRSM